MPCLQHELAAAPLSIILSSVAPSIGDFPLPSSVSSVASSRLLTAWYHSAPPGASSRSSSSAGRQKFTDRVDLSCCRSCWISDCETCSPLSPSLWPRQSGQNQSPSGTVVSGGSRQKVWQAVAQPGPSQSSITAPCSLLPHMLHGSSSSSSLAPLTLVLS